MSDEPRAVARSGDPGTSWEAAGRVQGIRASQAEVLGIFRRMGPMTDEQLVGILGTQASRQSVSGIRTRRSELAHAGEIVDTGRKRVGSTGRRMIVWGTPGTPRSVPPGQCSCGRGPVGHTDTHESTETPGIVRIVREGKTDQYMNVRRIEAETEARTRAEKLQAETKARDDAPRVDPRSHRLVLGGPVPCRYCKGTGGTVRDACVYCAGEGVR